MDKIIFVLLVLFPFGQIFKFDRFLIFDMVICAAAIYAIAKNLPKPKIFTHVNAFLLVATFSYLLFLAIYPNQNLLTGLLYLIRLFAYSYFYIFAHNLKNKEMYLSYLLSVTLIAALFGWIQYLIWPDLTALKYLGWDDHLLRLVGTYLDPTFLALIIIFGMIISIYKNNNLSLLFLTSTLVLTYSRVGIFIAMFLLITKRKALALLTIITLFLIIPKNVGEGTNFTRTVSGSNKIENFSQTIEIIQKYPLFGIGFNNLCFARNKYIGYQPSESHSCSGSDSSILFILATTGVLGLISVINLLVRAYRNIKPKFLNMIFLTGISIGLHSLFANSLFYPFVLFYLIMLGAITAKE